MLGNEAPRREWHGLPVAAVQGLLQELETKQPRTQQEIEGIVRAHGFHLLPDGRLVWNGKESDDVRGQRSPG